MGPFVKLDKMVTWTPPAASGSEHANHAKQQKSNSSPEPSFPPPPASAPLDQASHEPIYISSDDESTFDADEEASCDGSQDMDDSRSDDTLPSIDTIVASIKKSSPVFSSTRSLYDDANQPQLPDSDASRSSQEAATGPDISLSCTPTQASSAVQSHSLGSPNCIGLVAISDTVIPGHLPETLEVSSPPAPTLFSGSEAQCDSSESYEASNATTTPPQHGMEQTGDDSQSIGHVLGGCADSCSNSQPTSNASSNSDNLLQQREEPGLISPASLLPDISEDEEECSDKDEILDDNIDQPPNRQLRSKRTHKDRSTPEQDPADSDISSSSGSEAAVQDDEDYSPSPGRGEREQASNDSVDDEADSSDPPLPCKRRKVGGAQPSPRSHRRSKRLTKLTQIANSSGLHTRVRRASSVSSRGSFTAADAEMLAARYGEWPLQGATLKRLVVDGKMTFQLEFSWEPCVGGHAPGSHKDNRFQTQVAEKSHRTRRSPARHDFTREEDELIVKLKEEKQLPWPEIHEQFSDKFPQRRSQGSLQVRYCTKLKSGKRAGSKSRQGRATR